MGCYIARGLVAPQPPLPAVNTVAVLSAAVYRAVSNRDYVLAKSGAYVGRSCNNSDWTVAAVPPGPNAAAVLAAVVAGVTASGMYTATHAHLELRAVSGCVWWRCICCAARHPPVAWPCVVLHPTAALQTAVYVPLGSDLPAISSDLEPYWRMPS